jgi:predicted nucleotidyltransferase
MQDEDLTGYGMSELQKQGPGIEEIIGDKRAQIIALAARYGANNVRVFGSVARGEATPDSDVGLLVDQDWSRLSGWGGMELVVALEELLGRKVDIATEEELRPRIKAYVLREAVPL